MAEVFDALGKPERATELRSKAATLFARFNEVFWDEELGFYTLPDRDNSSPGRSAYVELVGRLSIR